jgi:uncharacterized alkaline shock family protein YloU
VSTALTEPATEADSATGGRPSAAGDGADALPELPEAGDRGSLTIADKVVERVAGYAVTQVPGASAAPRRVLGVNVGEARADAEASVTAKVEGRVATVSATVAIAWPQPVRAVAERLRGRIRDDVLRMTDVEVAQIDLDVVTFAAASTPTRRVQ